MNLTEKNKSYLIGASSLGAILFLLLLIGEIVLPFIFAIFVAYLLNPIILKIQKKIKNRYLAISSFLFVFTLLFVGVIFFFGSHMVNDAKRLVNSIENFTHENDEQIKNIKNSVLNFVDQAYESEAVKNQLENPKDLVTEENEKKLVSTLESVYSFFTDSSTNKEQSKAKSWSATYMLFYTLFYSIIILFSYDYFDEKYIKYFSNRKPINKRLSGILNDFKITFVVFFKQRSKVVFLNTVIFIIAFTIMDLPGAIIIGILSGLLSYASHFHYLSLPLVGIGSWVLSTESNLSFFLYFGIILFLFIIISILDETVYFEKIMKSVKGMNTAIVLLAFTLWIYVFGAFTGTIIALPLTQLILIYLDRLLLYSQDKSSK
jgi:predicted PurR-regulated permease PerM